MQILLPVTVMAGTYAVDLEAVQRLFGGPPVFSSIRVYAVSNRSMALGVLVGCLSMIPFAVNIVSSFRC